MGLSGQPSELSKQAKANEEKARAAMSEAKGELQASVKRASDAARSKAEELSDKAKAGKAEASDWWSQVQSDWKTHVAHARENMKKQQAEMDADASEVDA